MRKNAEDDGLIAWHLGARSSLGKLRDFWKSLRKGALMKIGPRTEE